jgi:hypothetical protein
VLIGATVALGVYAVNSSGSIAHQTSEAHGTAVTAESSVVVAGK